MTDLSPDDACSPTRRYAKARPRIPLPGGDYLLPRCQWAEAIGITDRTARKLDLPTVYVGGVAYVPHNASTQRIADQLKVRNEPPPRRRGHRHHAR